MPTALACPACRTGILARRGDPLCPTCGKAARESPESARQALGLAYQAADEGRYIPMPPLHALISLRHASAASLLGDKAAFQAAISQARRELNRGPWDGDPPQWLRFVSETEITETEATGYLDLGDAARSAMLYRQVLTSDLSPRNRASNGAGLADALLRQSAHQEAVATATDVLPALESGGYLGAVPEPASPRPPGGRQHCLGTRVPRAFRRSRTSPDRHMQCDPQRCTLRGRRVAGRRVAGRRIRDADERRVTKPAGVKVKAASGMPGETSNEVSGVIHGPSVQARQICGDVHIHQPPVPPPAPLPPPCQLPPPGLLLGRDADLQAMDAARGSRLIVVCGPPGVGKSALAVSWAHGVRPASPGRPPHCRSRCRQRRRP